MRRYFVAIITGCILSVTAVLVSGAGGLVLQHWKLFGGLIGLMMAIIMIAAFAGMGIRSRMGKQFHAALDGLPLAFRSFYDRKYAYGTCRGLKVYFTMARAGRGDISAPFFSGIMIFCTIKIPDTRGLPLYCALVPQGASASIRSFLGWKNPEEGFFIAKALNHSIDESMALFKRLSPAIKSGLRDFAARCGSVGIVPDHASVMIGEKHSLDLAGGDESSRALLDFQFKIRRDDRETLLSLLDAAIDLVMRVSSDLK